MVPAFAMDTFGEQNMPVQVAPLTVSDTKRVGDWVLDVLAREPLASFLPTPESSASMPVEVGAAQLFRASLMGLVLRQWPQSISAANQLLATVGWNPVGLLLRGCAYYCADDLGRAALDFAQAREQNPYLLPMNLLSLPRVAIDHNPPDSVWNQFHRLWIVARNDLYNLVWPPRPGAAGVALAAARFANTLFTRELDGSFWIEFVDCATDSSGASYAVLVCERATPLEARRLVVLDGRTGARLWFRDLDDRSRESVYQVGPTSVVLLRSVVAGESLDIRTGTTLCSLSPRLFGCLGYAGLFDDKMPWEEGRQASGANVPLPSDEAIFAAAKLKSPARTGLMVGDPLGRNAARITVSNEAEHVAVWSLPTDDKGKREREMKTHYFGWIYAIAR
jgi:hypothetical protein